MTGGDVSETDGNASFSPEKETYLGQKVRLNGLSETKRRSGVIIRLRSGI